MFSKYWLVIRDDTKRTFEVCGQVSNENAFTNKTYGMQQAGMNVSCMTPPVTGKAASKEAIKISGYTWENGLWDRLEKEYMRIRMKYTDDMEFE
ncbi:MAG: hypothetical protein JNK44_11310 [Cyclobacteriaceae bacterium]|nr:hypothetical protein [Cyclobacteriaceae bacterium]